MNDKDLIWRVAMIFIIVLFAIMDGWACSCSRVSFCDYLYGDNPVLVIRGEAIDTVTYSNLNRAVYFKVNEYLRDDYGVNEDIIKIYGSAYEASCDLNVMHRMPIGEERYLAVANLYDYPISVNPDSLNENYFELRPFLCQSVTLKGVNGVIRGHIDTDTLINDLLRYYTYPVAKFEERLKDNCSFNEDDISEDVCREDNFQLYPNPVTEYNFFDIRQLYSDKYGVDEVEIYSISGQLLQKENFEEGYNFRINCDSLNNGIYIVRIKSKNKYFVRKLVINR